MHWYNHERQHFNLKTFPVPPLSFPKSFRLLRFREIMFAVAVTGCRTIILLSLMKKIRTKRTYVPFFGRWYIFFNNDVGARKHFRICYSNSHISLRICNGNDHLSRTNHTLCLHIVRLNESHWVFSWSEVINTSKTTTTNLVMSFNMILICLVPIYLPIFGVVWRNEMFIIKFHEFLKRYCSNTSYIIYTEKRMDCGKLCATIHIDTVFVFCSFLQCKY